MAKKEPKLSAAMQKALDFYINAPFNEYENSRSTFYLEDESIYPYVPSYGKRKDGTIRSESSSATVKALEKRGLIEVIEIGGEYADQVRLLQHENTNKSHFETYDLVEVEIHLVSRNGVEWQDTGSHFLQDGNIEYAKNYWDYKEFRDDISRIVNKETGEEIYKR